MLLKCLLLLLLLLSSTDRWLGWGMEGSERQLWCSYRSSRSRSFVFKISIYDETCSRWVSFFFPFYLFSILFLLYYYFPVFLPSFPPFFLLRIMVTSKISLTFCHLQIFILGAFQILLMGLARTGNVGTVAAIIWGKLVHASIAMKNRKPRRK